MKTQWFGKKVAFLGDSITDKIHVGTAKNYWQFLQDYLEIKPFVYGKNGCQWSGIEAQAAEMKKECGSDIDAIFIFMGTNDFNNSVPIGEWWSIHTEDFDFNGEIKSRIQRTCSMDMGTLCGRINTGLKLLKEKYPQQQIVLITPIHRGYANFGGSNVQPDETYANGIGLFLDTYIDVIRKAGDIWSVPVIDLYSESGLMPRMDAYAGYFHDTETDRLHPAASGHDRIARVMMYKMLSMPSDFK